MFAIVTRRPFNDHITPRAAKKGILWGCFRIFINNCEN